MGLFSISGLSIISGLMNHGFRLVRCSCSLVLNGFFLGGRGWVGLMVLMV